MAKGPSQSVFCCPAHGVCSPLGLATSGCCYSSGDVRPSGMASVDPRQSWCPPALRGVIMMLAYSVSNQADGSHDAAQTLAEIRRWAETLRQSTPPCGGPADST